MRPSLPTHDGNVIFLVGLVEGMIDSPHIPDKSFDQVKQIIREPVSLGCCVHDFWQSVPGHVDYQPRQIDRVPLWGQVILSILRRRLV